MDDLSTPDLELRSDIPLAQMTRDVEQFVLDNPGADAFDIVVGVRIPFGTAKEILKDLVDRGILRAGE